MKKRLVTLFAVASILALQTSAFAQGSNTSTDVVSIDVANQDAVNFVNQYKTVFTLWKDENNLNVKYDRTLYDFDGQVSAYLFDVNSGNDDKGYVIESADPAKPGYIEAASDGTHPYAKTASTNDIYVGPSYFYSKVDQDHIQDLRDKKTIERKNLKSKGYLRNSSITSTPQASTPTTMAASATTTASATIVRSFVKRYVLDLPWTLGCAPTAATNVVDYYAQSLGYPNLERDMVGSGSTITPQAVVREMAADMNTDSAGSTTIFNTWHGLQQYFNVHGYVATVSNVGTSLHTYGDELSSHGPNIIAVLNDPTYGNHAVTGIGIVEMSDGTGSAIIHDSWHSSYYEVSYNWGPYISSVFSVHAN